MLGGQMGDGIGGERETRMVRQSLTSSGSFQTGTSAVRIQTHT